MHWRRIAPLLLATAAVCLAHSAITDPSGRLDAMPYSGETTAVRTNRWLPTLGWTRIVSLPGSNSSMTTSDSGITWKGSLALDSAHRIDYLQTLRMDGDTGTFAIDYTAVGNI